MNGAQGQTPQNVAQQIDQTVAEHRLQHTVQNVLQVFSPAVGLAYGAAANAEHAAAAASSGGGGYQFSPDEIDTAITKFEDIRDKAKALGAKIEAAADTVGPPAPDSPSARESTATRESLRRAYDHNVSLQKYATNFLGKLHAAQDDYLNSERDNSANAHRLGS